MAVVMKGLSIDEEPIPAGADDDSRHHGMVSMVVFVADLVDPKDPAGRTYREVNAEQRHAIPLGALVEHESGFRLFVVHHGRDCDDEPLYWLATKPDETNTRQWLGGYGEPGLRMPTDTDTRWREAANYGALDPSIADPVDLKIRIMDLLDERNAIRTRCEDLEREIPLQAVDVVGLAAYIAGLEHKLARAEARLAQELLRTAKSQGG